MFFKKYFLSRKYKDKLGRVVYVWNSSTQEAEIGGTCVQGQPGLSGAFQVRLKKQNAQKPKRQQKSKNKITKTQQNNKKTDNLIQKRADALSRQFSEEDKHVAESTGKEARHHPS